VKPISTHNPQANAILERIHQTIGNMIRTFKVYDNDGINDDNPWSGILAPVMAGVQSMYSTTTQAMPMQLVFGCDAILNMKFAADWNFIRQCKKQLIYNNNLRENVKRTPHTYRVDDKVLLKQHNPTKYGGPEYEGPYKITVVNAISTVHIHKAKYVVNIRNVKAYFR
jgi:hypothetical protein